MVTSGARVSITQRDFAYLRDPLAAPTIMGVNKAVVSNLIVAVAVVVASVGCAVPASVDGVLKGQGFTLRSNSPLSKPDASGRDTVVVLSEMESETLRTVNLHITNTADIALGAAVEIGTGAFEDKRPSVLVTEGDLVTETREDGVNVISSENDVRAESVSGTLTITERTADEISGSFHADLDDGGYVDGVFTAFPEQ